MRSGVDRPPISPARAARCVKRTERLRPPARSPASVVSTPRGRRRWCAGAERSWVRGVDATCASAGAISAGQRLSLRRGGPEHRVVGARCPPRGPAGDEAPVLVLHVLSRGGCLRGGGQPGLYVHGRSCRCPADAEHVLPPVEAQAPGDAHFWPPSGPQMRLTGGPFVRAQPRRSSVAWRGLKRMPRCRAGGSYFGPARHHSMAHSREAHGIASAVRPRPVDDGVDARGGKAPLR